MPASARLLIVDDEPMVLDLMTSTLESVGFETYRAKTGEEAITLMENEPVDLAILDYSLPDMSGRQLFDVLRSFRDELPTVFVTGFPNIEEAVELMKLGACDYLTKPIRPPLLVSRVRQVLELSHLSKEIEFTRNRSQRESNWLPGGYLAGESTVMREIEEKLQNVIRHRDATVLLTGPTGPGKSVAARRIHELTHGAGQPYVDIDCSTIPRDLCESELFGHEKGSFTGAHKSKPGLFEAAGGGTAFLDEVGELPPEQQVKLLRVLEERTFKRVGGHLPMRMRARVIAATNRSLPEMVQSGRFRSDLYYRLNVMEIRMPGLRERGADIAMLARQFLDYFSKRYDKSGMTFSDGSLELLATHSFSGNVRELRNLVERAVINAHSLTVDLEILELQTDRSPETPAPNPTPTAGAPSETTNLAELEKQSLAAAMESTGGNKTQAAKLVGLSRTAFLRRLEKYGLS